MGATRFYSPLCPSFRNGTVRALRLPLGVPSGFLRLSKPAVVRAPEALSSSLVRDTRTISYSLARSHALARPCQCPHTCARDLVSVISRDITLATNQPRRKVRATRRGSQRLHLVAVVACVSEFTKRATRSAPCSESPSSRSLARRPVPISESSCARVRYTTLPSGLGTSLGAGRTSTSRG